MNASIHFRRFALVSIAAFLSTTVPLFADDAYYNQGATFSDSLTHSISGGVFTGGPGMSVSFANYLFGVELDGGMLNMSGGSLIGGRTAGNSAANHQTGLDMLGGTANIFGGTIIGGGATNNTGVNYMEGVDVVGGNLNIYGGTISAGTTSGGSAANYLSGIEAELGNVNIYGGSIAHGHALGGAGPSFVYDIQDINSSVNIYGTGFNLPYGKISASSGELTGFLMDGSPIDWTFSRAGPGQITLIPEPGVASFAVIGLAIAGLHRRRHHFQSTNY